VQGIPVAGKAAAEKPEGNMRRAEETAGLCAAEPCEHQENGRKDRDKGLKRLRLQKPACLQRGVQATG